ncbi:hypothetical protein IGI04_013719, partial [Brassica rapa subsp. trilocularis]
PFFSSFFIYCYLSCLQIKTLKTLKSRSMAMKPIGKSIVSSDYDDKVMFFKDVSLVHHKSQLRFRLIHFWEAWNPVKNTLIGLEMLLIDEQYLPEMKRGSVYKLNNFYGSRNKSVFRVSDRTATVSFSWNSELSVLQGCHTPFDEDSFRFHSYEEFQAKCDLKGDLYDNLCNAPHVFLVASFSEVGLERITFLCRGLSHSLKSNVVGHMKLVNGQSIIETPVLDEVEIAKARRVLDRFFNGPVMKLYLWDQAARDFCIKFKSYGKTPTVLLVTTVNAKTLGGTLALTSMSSSRVFMDYDVQPTIDYFGWALIQLLMSRLMHKWMPSLSARLQSMTSCMALLGTTLHAVGAILKVTKGPTSMICTNSKCGKVNVSGVAQYRSKISVYDNSEQAFLYYLVDAGSELTGKPASELVRNYFESNADQEGNHEAPVPEDLISTIGQRHKFCVKVTELNLSGKTRSLTVTKNLPLDIPPATKSLEGNHTTATSEETFKNSGFCRGE